MRATVLILSLMLVAYIVASTLDMRDRLSAIQQGRCYAMVIP